MGALTIKNALLFELRRTAPVYNKITDPPVYPYHVMDLQAFSKLTSVFQVNS
jgi:hypothetical protein